jgi:SAM-dependent methyltransferase
MKKMKKMIKGIASKSHNEDGNMMKLFHNIDRESKILDVGCGYGTNLLRLKSLGFKNLYGTDIKKETIDVIKLSFNAFLSSEIDSKIEKKSMDVIIMSHIVEHFEYEKLKLFIEFYLEYLKEGGMLYVSTPLFTNHFYDDFDHVKPYHIDGLLLVFTESNKQVQFKSKYNFTLENMYFRTASFRINYYRSRYIKSYNKIPQLINLLFQIFYLLTFALVGKKTGWQAVFNVKSIDLDG